MSEVHNDDVQKLLVHFKRGLLSASPSSSELLQFFLNSHGTYFGNAKFVLRNEFAQVFKLRGMSGSRSHRRRRSSLPDDYSERAPTSPRTPARTVREVTNTEQSATTEFETPPSRTSNGFLRF